MLDATSATIESTLQLPRLNVKNRQLYDLEMLLVDGFDPLAGFMNEDDYSSVVNDMRLADGTLFPIPIVLDVDDTFIHKVGDEVLLCDPFGNPLAVLAVESIYKPNKEAEAKGVYGTTDEAHPGVHYLMYEMGGRYVGGTVNKLSLPTRNDFKQWRKTPAELKALFAERGWDNVVGFQTRNPMHRAHFELVRRAHERTSFPVLVHPVVGMTKPGDVDYVTRVRTYNVVCNSYGKDFTELSLLPLAMRMAGPREALWHAIIRKNYGCTHFIVGRDHAGPGNDSKGQPFYHEAAARELATKHANEIGIEILTSEELAYSKSREIYVSHDELEVGEETEHISGTEFRRRLNAGEDIPDWFSFPESIKILRESVKRDTRPGLTLFFTGLPQAGKTTIAELLVARLQEIQDRSITLLDGDVIRQHLSKGLTFSKEDRDENVRRVGFVASEMARHGGVCVTSLIAPYAAARRQVRSMVEHHGVFVEIHVATSVDECEKRDTKGNYKKARAGEITGFTGVDDPYEEPVQAELKIETVGRTPAECADEIIVYLEKTKLI